MIHKSAWRSADFAGATARLARLAVAFGALGRRASKGDGTAGTEDLEALGGDIDRDKFTGLLFQEAEADEFAAIGSPLGAAGIGADAIDGEFLVAPLADGVGIGADEDLDDVIETECEAGLLADAIDGGEKFLGVDGAVEGAAWNEAIIAGLTVGCVEGLAKVLEEPPAAAGGVLAEMDHLAKLLAGELALVGIGLFLDKVELLCDVAWGEEEKALGWKAVAAGAACLLVIALGVLWEIVVDDEADIGFVDAHAECDGGADDLNLVAEETLLVA